MTANPFHQAIYLTGPTAAGKTAVSIRLAERLDAEILALDSMTLYRGMDIGTAKPTLKERGGVPHHLIDVLDPTESASVADYRSWAQETLQAVYARKRRALFVGGTALYLKALLRGLFEGPEADSTLRAQLDEEADRLGLAQLHAQLRSVDPAAAHRIHPNDRKRIIRALEVFRLTGEPMSRLQAQHDQAAPEFVPVFALDPPRPVLHDQINRRVDRMFEDGFLEEVDRLRAHDPPWNPVPAQAVGYREAKEALEGPGTVAIPDLIAQIQAHTRQFAKRQQTWFRGLAEVESVPVDPSESPASIADRILERIEKRGSST